jgi:hypothetical protein
VKFTSFFLLPACRDGSDEIHRSRRDIPCIEAALMIVPV